MTISAQLKQFHGEDINALIAEAEEKATEITHDWDAESTEFDFVDGSVLVVCGQFVSAYGSR
jgi:hypothetical protein